MTQAEYEARNLLGFEGDEFIKKEIDRLIAKHKINLLIETGTYLGGTTKRFSEMVKDVITIEFNPDFFVRASKYLEGIKNITMYIGSSVDVLPKLLDKTKSKKLFIFLDAHWHSFCPLKDELKHIADAKLKPVIAIHDWKVPGTDFGYDSYNGQDFTYEWIKKDLDAVYSVNGYTFHYNEQAEGAKRGIIYIEPK